MKLSPNEIAYVANLFFADREDAKIMVAIALAESGGDTNVMGRSPDTSLPTNRGNWDHGLWQISNRWHGEKLATMGNWRDPYVNGQMAARAYFERGFEAWSVYTSKSYEKFLFDAGIAMQFPVAPSLV